MSVGTHQNHRSSEEKSQPYLSLVSSALRGRACVSAHYLTGLSSFTIQDAKWGKTSRAAPTTWTWHTLMVQLCFQLCLWSCKGLYSQYRPSYLCQHHACICPAAFVTGPSAGVMPTTWDLQRVGIIQPLRAWLSFWEDPLTFFSSLDFSSFNELWC